MAKKDKIYFGSEETVAFTERFWEKKEYPLHYHNCYEMELILDGSGYQIVNGEMVELHKQSFYIIRPLDHHQIVSDGITIANISLSEESIPKWCLKTLFAQKTCAVLRLDDDNFEKIAGLFSLVKKEYEMQKKYFQETISLICELIFTYYFRLIIDEEEDKSFDFLKRVLYYLQHNRRFTEKVTLEDIAQYASYSKYYTSSMFHKLYGMTIQEFIVTLRIEYAKKLLLESDLPITDIVLESGFASNSNFYLQFTKLVGISPTQYRKNMRKENQNENIA